MKKLVTRVSALTLALWMISHTGLSLSAAATELDASPPSLSQWLEREIIQVHRGISCAPEALGRNGQEPAATEVWTFKRFWLRLRTKVGVGIPELSEALVVPEVELLWESN